MAKSISLVSSKIKYVAVEKTETGALITVVGAGLDADGNPYPSKNLVMDWAELPANIQNTGDNFLKHMSKEFNKLVADEDSEVW